MKEIPLTQGKVALIDDEDYEWISQFKWYAYKGRSTFYSMRNIKGGNPVRLHREILKRNLGENFKDSFVVDHINHNGLDNRKGNLRLVTNRENLMNQKNKSFYSSIYPGVFVSKGKYRNKKYVAQIRIGEKRKFLGSFYTEIEAAITYVKAVYGPEWLYE